MVAYLIRHFLLAILSLWVISIGAFGILTLPPGDAVDVYISRLEEGGGAIGIKQAEDLRERLHLNDPWIVQYGNWVWGLVRLDPGFAFWAREQGEDVQQRRVGVIVGDTIWTTIALSGFTIVFTWTLALPIGIYSAVRQHSVGDYTFTMLGFTGMAVPDFLLALVLMYIAFAYFDQSVGGLFSTEQLKQPWSMAKVWDLITHLWIPAAVLGTSGTASLIRIMRNNLLDELGKPYVITARAKGLSEWRLIIKYPVRVAINPVVSTVGYLLPALVGGSIIVSVVLSLPTLGPVFLRSIQELDMYLAGFIIMVLGFLTIVGTLLSDILLAVVDPRIKFGRR